MSKYRPFTPEEVMEVWVDFIQHWPGCTPQYLYAMKKTGRMLTEMNEHLWTDQELAEWDAAIAEFKKTNGNDP